MFQTGSPREGLSLHDMLMSPATLTPVDTVTAVTAVIVSPPVPCALCRGDRIASFAKPVSDRYFCHIVWKDLFGKITFKTCTVVVVRKIVLGIHRLTDA